MQTLYEKLGPEKLNAVLDTFYDLVFTSPVISNLFKGDKKEIKEKQLLFLTQFLGGPPLYSQKYGHPKMRLRHLPHRIDETAKNEWLKLMKIAIDENIVDKTLAEALYNCFPPLAQHMVNTP